MARSRKWLIFAAIPFVVAAALIELAAPLLRSHIQDLAAKMLNERLDSQVSFGEIHVSLYPRITISGKDLVLRHQGRTDVPPLIQIKTFAAHAGLLPLLRSTSHVNLVTIEGLRIHVPPRRKEDRPARTGPKKRKAYPVVIDQLIADKTELLILPRDAGKDARHFQIHRLTMQSVGLDRAAPFQARLTNPKPPGEIVTNGQFGPWRRDEPSQTPLAAAYSFTSADLGVFRGIAGILSSKGQFGGVLENIYVQGETSTPDFRVRTGNHPVPLLTRFDAIVDGTNGNTLLTPVRARFFRTALICNGGVARPAGAEGRTVFLEVKSDDARLEDLLRLAMNADKPPMTGAVRLKTKFELPPGDAEVFERLKLDGEFNVGGGRFTSVDVRSKLAALSRRGQGQPENENAGSSISNLTGRFRMANGIVTFSRLRFGVTGATALLSGSYTFRGEALDFHGELRLDAKVSQTTTGLKSVLLRAVDPLFRRKGAGAVVPFHIAGTRSNPSFGLDIGHIVTRR